MRSHSCLVANAFANSDARRKCVSSWCDRSKFNGLITAPGITHLAGQFGYTFVDRRRRRKMHLLHGARALFFRGVRAIYLAKKRISQVNDAPNRSNSMTRIRAITEVTRSENGSLRASPRDRNSPRG